MIKFHKNLRLKNFDYSSDGAYFVTICTDKRKPIIDDNYKQLIKKELSALEKRFSGLKIDFYVLMKDHLHVIFLLSQCKANLPSIIQAFKSITTLKLKRVGFNGKIFWQKNYYEHMIRDEKKLNKIREYIRNNPEAEKLKFENIY